MTLTEMQHLAKGSGTLSTQKCPIKRHIFGMWNHCPHPYTTRLHKAFPDRTLCMQSRAFWMSQILHTNQWGNIWGASCISFPKVTENNFYILHLHKFFWFKLQWAMGIVVLFKSKVGANFKVFSRPRFCQNLFEVNGRVWISRAGHLNHANWPRQCNFRAVHNYWESEHNFWTWVSQLWCIIPI